MAKVTIYDTFRVVASSQLSSDDIQVLTLLYQPIIGNDSFTLYFTLFNLLDRQTMVSEKIIHKQLCDIINIKPSSFDVVRSKLEAVGLLRTLKNEKEYVYFLNMPLSAKIFMSGDLGPFLYTKIGDELFKNLYKRFTISKIDKTQYMEVTKSFDDVFECNSIAIKNDELLLERKTGVIEFKNTSFDLDCYLDGMKAFIDRRKITDRFKKIILRLAYTYGLNYQEMVNVSMAAFDGQAINQELLNKKARDYYQSKSKVKTPNIVLKETEDDTDDEIIKVLNSSTPKDILESLSGMGAAVADLDAINTVWEKTGWDKAVINAFVLYILKIKDNKLPSFNYLDKVASEWKRSGINTAKMAKEYLYGTHKEEKEKTKGSQDQWLDDWYKKAGEIEDE